jgi:hypothetical protein
MEMKWVDDSVVDKIKVGRAAKHDVASFIEQLYANPNKWAQYPHQISSHDWGYKIPKRFANIEVKQTGGNNLSVSHADKKDWTVYMRYVPVSSKEENIETK